MEMELYNFMFVWSTVFASLCYCHGIAKVFPEGKERLLAILPVVCVFLVLPLQLASVHYGGISSFLISWLACFKLLLLQPEKALYLLIFLFLDSSLLPFFRSKLGKAYDYKSYLHPMIVYFIYALHMYFAIELVLAALGAGARALVGVELEPQFNKPYLSTSLQDFWGKRWNLMVTNILRQTVYDPVRTYSASFLGRTAASLAALMATFFVSGVMHELVFYGLGRVIPTGEVTCFFLLQGVAVAIEIILKKKLRGKIQVPRIISGPLAIGFVIYSSSLLFFPPLMRGKVDVRACKESLAFIEFVKHGKQLSPSNFTCPYF